MGQTASPRLLRPFPAFSARVTHARDPFFAPETIARRRPVLSPPLWVNDAPHAMPASREEAARRGARDGGRRPIFPPPRPSWEEGPTEDRESVYTTLRVRIRGYARARPLQRERELSQNNLL